MIPSPDTVPALDNFDRPNGPIGGRWQDKILASDTPGFNILSGKAVANQSSGFGGAWNDSLFATDSCIVATVTGNLASDGAYLWLSISNPGVASVRGYCAYIFSNSRIDIKRYEAGFTMVKSNTGLTLTSGDTLAFVRLGPNLAVYQRPVATGVWNPVPIATGFDPQVPLPAGYPGIGADWISIGFDNVRAGLMVDPEAPVSTVVDSFTRTDEAPLYFSGYVPLRTGEADFQLLSNQVLPMASDTIGSFVYLREKMRTPDMEVQIRLATPSFLSGEFGVILRAQRPSSASCAGIICRIDCASTVSPNLEFGYYSGGSNGGTYDSYTMTNLNVGVGDKLMARAIGEYVYAYYFSVLLGGWKLLKVWRAADYSSEFKTTIMPGGYPGFILQAYTAPTRMQVKDFGYADLSGYVGAPETVPSWTNLLRESKLPINANRGDNNPERVGRFD